MSVKDQHRKDVDKLAPKLADAVQGVFAAQKSKVTKRAALPDNAIATTKAAVLPHIVSAVKVGASRVASVVGNGTPSPTTTLAGAWAYKFADQLTATTQGQLDDLDDTADADDVGDVFDGRSDLALAMAATIISNAINSGAQNYAATLPATEQPTKTWEVTDDDPCTECSSVTGETVSASEDFSNGAPHGPIHSGCGCTVDWTAATTSSTQRSRRMATYQEWRADKYSADDMKDMLAKGKAMKNAAGDPSYPVADQEDIEKAVKAVGRGGADHDAIRAHIIKGAKAQKLTKLIPDNWNADGSLADAEAKSRVFVPETREQRAEDSLSFGDIQSAVYEALIGTLPGRADVWIVDLGSNWVVYQDYWMDGLYKATYSMDDGNLVTFDADPVRVDRVTSFVPVEQKNSVPDGETRADKKVKCPTCTGKGTILEGNRECPDCKGTGEVDPDVAAGTEQAHSASRRPRRQKRSLERAPEWRRFSTQFERRVTQDGNDLVLSGVAIRYAAPYSVRDMLGTFRETMQPGVVTRAMESKDFDCRFLINHEGMPLARSVSGTLVIEDTPRGVRVEPHMDARSNQANDLAIAVERGDVTQMSVGFVVATGGDEWRWADDGIEERDVYSFDEWFDASAVTYPASPTTSLELAERMLAKVGVESRERIRRLFAVGGAVRSGGVLSQRDGDELRAAAEALYRVDGAVGVPMQARMDAYTHAVDALYGALRAGKVLSADNQQALQNALDALHAADDIDIPGITAQLETIDKALDAGQAGLAGVLGKASPDGDKADKNPTLVNADDPAGDKDARSRQRQKLKLVGV